MEGSLQNVKRFDVHAVKRRVKFEEILRLLQSGLNLKQVSAVMKMHYWTVRRYASSGEFREMLKAYSGELWEKVDGELKEKAYDKYQMLEEASSIALEQMLKLAEEGTSEIVRLKASQDLMDRNPEMSRTRRVEGDQGRSLDPTLLKAAAAVIREEEEFNRRVIDITPEKGSNGDGEG